MALSKKMKNCTIHFFVIFPCCDLDVYQRSKLKTKTLTALNILVTGFSFSPAIITLNSPQQTDG